MIASAQLKFEAIGTHWQIDLPNTSKKELVALEKKILFRIDEFDKKYSRFRKDSIVWEMAAKTGKYDLGEDFIPLIDLYQKLYQLTDGLVTPLIGKTMEECGYDSEYSLVEKKLTKVETWDETIEINGNKIDVKKPVLLDFGAAGKGYLIDLVAEIIKKEGIEDFSIDAGGDIVNFSSSGDKLRIGLEDPEDFSKVIGVVGMGTGAICASSGSRRKWGRFHHIINPKTLESVRDVRAVWVVANQGLEADGLSTALFFVSPEKLLEDFDFEYVILNEDYSALVSKNFPGEVF